MKDKPKDNSQNWFRVFVDGLWDAVCELARWFWRVVDFLLVLPGR